MDYLKFKDRNPKHVASAPIIYFLAIPFMILDVFVELYHQVCFPLYGLEKVNRTDYIIMDRHKLEYLSGLEKLNCVYCGYVNGLLLYVTEIAARTEQYWCSIKHDYAKNSVSQPHHSSFLEYGDKAAYIRKKAGMEEKPHPDLQTVSKNNR